MQLPQELVDATNTGDCAEANTAAVSLDLGQRFDFGFDKRSTTRALSIALVACRHTRNVEAMVGSFSCNDEYYRRGKNTDQSHPLGIVLMSTSDTQASSLKRYKTLRRRFLYLLLGFTPMMTVLLVLTRALIGTYLPAWIVCFALMAIMTVMSIRLRTWPCPECGNLIGWWPPFVARCRHCGFPHGEDARKKRDRSM
jgi:hypothetical protein